MTTAGPLVQNFLDKLSGVKQTGSGWQAKCPCRNDDENPSLSIGEGDDGRVLITCHRGICGAEEICSAVGMKIVELMPPKIKDKDQLEFVKAYKYVDADGKLLFEKVRYIDQDGKKTFRQRKPGFNGSWTYSLGDTPKVLYNLPEVLKAKEEGTAIWVVEGEKDADTLTSMGLVATTMPGGAGKWLGIHTSALAGALVEIVADNDEPGRMHAELVLRELSKAGCDAQVWICPDKKDITDHLNNGLTFDDLLPYEENVVIPELIVEEPSPHAEAIAKLLQIIENDDLDPIQKIAKTSMLLSTIGSRTINDPGRLVQWNEFIAETTDDSYDWVIPGLLERGERVIVVAAEGVGKTMLARQIALCSAAGLHPFTRQAMKPVCTLTVDLENPERIIRRTSTSILVQAMKYGHVQKMNGHILTKPSGMDLLKAEDRLILEEAIERVKPDILVMGPLYKAFVDPGGRTSEAVAVEVAKYLDVLRTVYGCALWLEHHAPLGTSMSSRDLRPFGSAVWSRWPEFGLSLTPDPTANEPYVYDVRHFRGARDERQWPTKIKRGKVFPFEVIEYNKIGT